MKKAVNINSITDLIDFINRKDVSKSDALQVAKQCFKVENKFNIPYLFDEETYYSKTDIIEIINFEPPDLWFLDLPDIGNRK